MGNKEILFKKLDEILTGMYEYSVNLGYWGKYVWIIIYPEYGDGKGYSAWGFVVDPDKINEFEHQKVCNSCYVDIYVSEYDPITDNYIIYINEEDIYTTKKNSKKIKELIRNIEILGIDVYNMIRNLYLDPSKSYPKLSIDFRRDISDEEKIRKEIKESTIFGQHISDGGNKNREKPVFRFISLKGGKTNIYNGGIKLYFPDHFRFSYIIYG